MKMLIMKMATKTIGHRDAGGDVEPGDLVALGRDRGDGHALQDARRILGVDAGLAQQRVADDVAQQALVVLLALQARDAQARVGLDAGDLAAARGSRSGMT